MKLAYLPALDGVRTLAVGLVILLHWPFPALQLPFGWAGVNVFFVLSGFLITRILLNTKEQPHRLYLQQFYRNRLLRIFPLYYGYLLSIGAILLGLNVLIPEGSLPEVLKNGLIIFRKDFGLLVSYLYNLNDLFGPANPASQVNASPFFSHLWSLAIEEQYYLVFPFLVYFLPRKGLIGVLGLVILLTPGLRLLVGESFRFPENEPFIGLILTKLTVFHLDGFALGGLLALLPVSRINNPQHWLILALILIATSGLFITWYLRKNGIEIGRKSLGLDHPLYQYQQQPGLLFFNIRYAFTYTWVNLIAALLLLTALHKNRLAGFMKSRILVFTGKLTYGIYIFHFPLLAFFMLALEKLKIEEAVRRHPVLELLAFAVYLVPVISLAWLSFRFFESYFLRRKHQLATTKLTHS